MTDIKLWKLSIFTQSLNCLKSRYLSFFSSRGVSRHAGTDVRPFLTYRKGNCLCDSTTRPETRPCTTTHIFVCHNRWNHRNFFEFFTSFRDYLCAATRSFMKDFISYYYHYSQINQNRYAYPREDRTTVDIATSFESPLR
jgi:hypothetical protein